MYWSLFSVSQVTQAGDKTLVVKDVGVRRWLILRDNSNGSIACRELERDSTNIRFSCSGTDPCRASPCQASDWLAIGEVSLPLSFFAIPQ